MNNTGNFGWYETYRTNLQNILKDSVKELRNLGITHLNADAEEIASRVESDVFRILVLGEFKRGKSTFINALLGQEVLPAYATPCTAVINEISWAEHPSASVFFKNPLPEPLPVGLLQSVLNHIRSEDFSPTEPMFLDLGDSAVESLEEVVTIPDPGKDQSESVSHTPFERVEIKWPLEILKNDVQVIDSPGLNEHTTRTAVTMNYLGKVDAVICVMTSLALASASELRAIDADILPRGHADIFFLCNFFDMIREKEKQKIISYAHDKLAQRTSFGKEGIYFISAFQALEGMERNDDTLVQQSGVPAVKDALVAFLANDRARVKLGQPAREIRTIIEGVLSRDIPQKQSMLHQDLGKLRDAYDENRPALDLLRKKQAQTMRGLEQNIDRSTRLVRSELLNWYRGFADKVPQLVEEMELENEISVLTFKSTKEQAKAMSEEIVLALQGKMETDFEDFRSQEFDSILEREISTLGEDAVQKTARLIDELRCIAATISGAGASHVEDRKAIERGVAAAIGFLLGGVGSSAAGLFGGYREMAMSLIPQVGLVLGMLALGILNPWIIIPVLLGGSGIQMLISGGAATKKIKAKVAEELSNQLRVNASEQADLFAENIRKKFTELIKPVETHLNKEIDAVEEQVEQALNDLKQGKAHVEEKTALLQATADNLNNMREKLIALEGQLAG